MEQFSWCYDCIELLLETIFTVLETSSKTFPWYWRFLHCTRDNFEGCSWCWRLPHHPGDTFVTIFAVVETQKNFHGSRDSFRTIFRVLGATKKLFSQCWRHLQTHFYCAGNFFIAPETLLRDKYDFHGQIDNRRGACIFLLTVMHRQPAGVGGKPFQSQLLWGNFSHP